MLSKLEQSHCIANTASVVPRLRARKYQTLSRFFRLLSSVQYTQPSKTRWKREFRVDREAKAFIVLIFVSYKKWKHQMQSGELKDMELKAVRNDPHIILDFLNYRHDDNSRKWVFLMDFDLEYRDWTGVTKVIPRTAMPTKAKVLQTLYDTTQTQSSGFIHVGAHCMYGSHGASYIKVRGRNTTYVDIPTESTGPKTAYFISSDGQRVYGNEFYDCLSDDDRKGRDSTLTLSFDMCNAGEYLQDAVSLLSLASAPPNSGLRDEALDKPNSQRQLVVISSAQKDQVAGSINNPVGLKGVFGASTALMIRYLTRNPSAKAADVIQYLNQECQKRPEIHLRQSPCIASRYPIDGPLRLLPDSMNSDNHTS